MTGIIIKALSGFYYVKTDEDKIIQCRARGKFRKNDEHPLVGDFAEISLTGSCVHPCAITCLELVYGQLTLVKWTTCVDERRYMYVCREEISGKKNLCQLR